MISSVPAVLVPLVRSLRTALLRAVEPFDVMHRVMTGQRGLPPLWLRRHAGPLAAFERSPAEISAVIALLELCPPGTRVLDAGCGVGAMAFELQRGLGNTGRYIGFDVHKPSIEWAQRAFATDERLTFTFADLRTPYSRNGIVNPFDYEFPAESGVIDLVIAKSLFTHLQEAEARRYLVEIARVLASGGRGLVSAFLFDRQPPPAPDALYEFPWGDGRMRWLVRGRPEAGIAWSHEQFRAMVDDAGLKVERQIDGWWREPRLAPNAQDLLIVRPQ